MAAASSNAQFNAPATLYVGKSDGSGSFSGTMRSNGGALSFTKMGMGTQELAGANIIYTGATTISQGTLRLTNASGFASSVSFDPANAVTLQLNAPAAGDSWTYNSQIDGGSSNARIEKIGAGNVILAPAAGSSFIGSATAALTVTAGKLYLNGGNFTTAPAASVAAGATLGGTGRVGPTIIADGGAVEAGFGGAGKLTFSDLTFNGAGAIDFGTLTNYAASPGAVITDPDALDPAGGSGSITINIGNLSNATVNSTYKLIAYSGAIGGSGFAAFQVALPNRVTGNLVNNPGEIDLTVTGTDYLVWTGAGNLANGWDTTTANWKLHSTDVATTYLDNPGDTVVFDDSAGSGNSSVVLATADVHPASVTFENTNVDYTLSGSKAIAAGSLTKSGTGMLTITNVNSYAGGTNLNGGVLSFGNGALGTGAIVMNGGTLQWNGANTQDVSSALVLVDSTAATFDTNGNDVTLASGFGAGTSGTLVKTGAGMLTLSGGNSYTGGTTLSQGTLRLTSVGAAGTGPVILGDANTGANNLVLNIATGASITTPITVAGQGTGAVTINVNAISNPGGTGLITLDRATTLNAPNISGNLQFDSPLAGSGELIIGNTNATRFILNTLNDMTGDDSGFTGDIDIKANAIFEPRDDLSSPTGNSVTVETGGVLNIAFSPTAINALAGMGTMRCQFGAATLTIGKDNGSGVFTGAMADAGAALAIEKAGTGTEEFRGASISYSGATTIDTGTLVLTDTSAFASPITLGATDNLTLQLNAPSDSWTLATAISGGSANATVLKTGAGEIVLTADNSYVGATVIDAGQLTVNGSIAGGNTITVNDSGTLAGTGSVIGDVTLMGGTTGAALASSGTLTLDSTLTVGGTNNAITAGTIAVAGTTTIATGATLTVNGTLAGTSPATVNGTLRGSGTVGQPVVVAGGGMIAGASHSLLTLTGGLTLNDDSLSTFELTAERRRQFHAAGRGHRRADRPLPNDAHDQLHRHGSPRHLRAL